MITVMVPAFNEEKYIKESVINIIKASKELSDLKLDIVVVNDGSTDRTAEMIRELEEEFPIVRSLQHSKSVGIGGCFLEVLQIAKYDRITVFPGDNYSSIYLIKNLFKNYDKADLVISYTINSEVRGRKRNVLSVIFCTIYMLIFNVHVKYINGSAVYPTKLLRSLDIHSRGYNVFAEIHVKLLRMRLTYLEVDGYMKADTLKSSAISLKNLFYVISSFLYLLYEINFKFRTKYSEKAQRVIKIDI